jgi:voltage-gated potassium channel Kch
MAKRNDLGARLRYEFDKSMSAGPIALIGWLALFSLLIIVAAAVVIALIGIAPEGGEPLTFLEAFWASLMRTLDAGTMGADAGWGFRIIMLLVTIGGIFIVSTLIGILASGIEGKLADLRKGRSRAIESDHTVILNWSASIFDVLSELVTANASRKNPRIVIMANRDKVEMEDEIAAKVKLGKTKVICRSGDPTDLYDLSLTAHETSRSVIILSPDVDDADGNVLKSVLALVNGPDRRPSSYRIAAEMKEAKNAELAKVIGGREVQTVLADDLIARIVVHSSRQSGLSAVYSELLDFEGSEIYALEQTPLVGNTFGDALMAYNTSTLIGVCDAAGRVYLNPPMETQMQPGLKAVIIAEDDAQIKIAVDNIEVDMAAIQLPRTPERQPERTLMLGWNRRAPIIARELSRYVIPGSLLTVAADVPDLDGAIAGLAYDANNLTIEYGTVDTTNRATLESLDVLSYDHVLVLGYSDILPAQATDTRTLVTLLHLRKIAEQAKGKLSVVSEMIDVRNRELAEVTRADDFVVSNRLVSLMLAQASENDNLSAIFEDLLDEQGSEIYMRPAGDYIELGRPINFYTVVEAARRRGEVAIGYSRKRQGADDPRKLGGVVVNPKKNEAMMYQQGDRVIVLARE